LAKTEINQMVHYCYLTLFDIQAVPLNSVNYF